MEVPHKARGHRMLAVIILAVSLLTLALFLSPSAASAQAAGDCTEHQLVVTASVTDPVVDTSVNITLSLIPGTCSVGFDQPAWTLLTGPGFTPEVRSAAPGGQVRAHTFSLTSSIAGASELNARVSYETTITDATGLAIDTLVEAIASPVVLTVLASDTAPTPTVAPPVTPTVAATATPVPPATATPVPTVEPTVTPVPSPTSTPDPTPTPEPASTATPTAAGPTPTPEPPAPTPVVELTPVSVTVTPTPEPTATVPAATPTVEPTSEATPTATVDVAAIPTTTATVDVAAIPTTTATVDAIPTTTATVDAIPTSTGVPTATPAEPTATPIALSTSTPTPTVAPTPTATPTPTPSAADIRPNIAGFLPTATARPEILPLATRVPPGDLDDTVVILGYTEDGAPAPSKPAPADSQSSNDIAADPTPAPRKSNSLLYLGIAMTAVAVLSGGAMLFAEWFRTGAR